MSMKRIFWICFVTCSIWGSRLPGITIPFIGTLYPLRIFILLSPFFILLNYYHKWASCYIKIKKNTYYFFGVILLYGILTLFWTINISAAITSLIVYITSFLVVIICIYLIKDEKDIIFIAKAYTLNVILICVIGIYESFTGNYIFNYTVYEHYTRTFNIIGLYRPLVFFNNINNLATFIVVSIPICFIAFENSRFKSIKRLFIFTLCTTVVFLIGSRAAILGSCLFVILFLFNKLRLKKIVSYMALLLIIIFSLLLFVASPYFESFILSIKDEARILIWINTLKVSADYFFMGVGPGNSYYMNLLNQYEDISGVYAVHNYLLELLVEFGVVGASCFIMWIVNLILGIRRNIKCATMSIKYMLNMFFIFIVLFILLSICSASMSGMYFIWLNFGIGLVIINWANKCKRNRES